MAFTEHVDFTEWGEEDRPSSPTCKSSGRRASVSVARVAPLDVEGYSADLAAAATDSRTCASARHRGGRAAPVRRQRGRVLAAGPFERVLGSLHAVADDGRLAGVDALYARYRRGRGDAPLLRRTAAVLVGRSTRSRCWRTATTRAATGRRTAGQLRRGRLRGGVPRGIPRAGRLRPGRWRSTPAARCRRSDLLRWWREEGGGAVSFGSDAHQAVPGRCPVRPGGGGRGGGGLPPGPRPLRLLAPLTVSV